MVGARSGTGGASGVVCERELRFMAVELDEHPPFDVIIVADHSDSLSWSRADLAAGLRTLLGRVHGHSARFFVLTPTQYGATTSGAIHPDNGEEIVPWRDPVTGEPFANAMTAYSQTCTDTEDNPIDCPAYGAIQPAPFFRLSGSFRFLMPEPVAAISPEMSTDEILVQQQAVSEAILNLGGGGSSREQPLCTLNRYVLQNPSPLPERAVFVVLSDEDDTTLPAECLAGFEYQHELVENEHGESCTSECDSYRYDAGRSEVVETVEFTCVPVDDMGTPHLEGGYASKAHLDPSGGSTCTAVGGPRTCDSAGLARATGECRTGHAVQNCASRCEEVQRNACRIETTAQAPDFCAGPFSYQGTDYASFEAYCSATVGPARWSACHRVGFRKATMERSREQRHPVGSGWTAEHMVTSFRQAATRAFGANGFLVEVIGFDPAFACELGSGQSYATHLQKVATSPADVSPICGDYSQALEGVSRFAQRLLQNELEIRLKSSETIASVRVIGENGVERELLGTSYRYDGETEILHIDRAALRPTDVGLSVEIDDRCKAQVD